MTKTTQITGNKTCTKCGAIKSITEFYKRGGKTSPETRHNHCKECTKSRVTAKYKEDPSLYREQHLQRSYGIGRDEYSNLLEEQNNQCAICKSLDPKGKHNNNYFPVDHCHSTNKVRGLLCHNCNTSLGLVGDNIQTLETMINYLQTHQKL